MDALHDRYKIIHDNNHHHNHNKNKSNIIPFPDVVIASRIILLIISINHPARLILISRSLYL